jgi:hypothetical protein
MYLVSTGILFGWENRNAIVLLSVEKGRTMQQICPLTCPFPHILRDCENRMKLLDKKKKSFYFFFGGGGVGGRAVWERLPKKRIK